MLELLSFVLLISSMLVLIYLLKRQHYRSHINNQYSVGLAYHQSLFNLIIHSQQHRGLNSAYINGDENFYQPLQQKSQQVEQALRQLLALQHDNHVQQLPLTSEQLKQIDTLWQNIVVRKLKTTPMENFALHCQLIEYLMQCLLNVSDESQLLYHPTPHIAHKIQLAAKLLPEMTEYIGQVRALASGAAARKQCTPIVKVRLQFALQQMQQVKRQLTAACSQLPEYQQLKQPLQQLHDKTQQLNLMVRQELLQVARIQLDPAQLFSLATETIQLLIAIAEDINQQLEQQHNFHIDTVELPSYS